MSNHQQDQSGGIRPVQREEPLSLANVLMDTVGGATRLGINLASLPLGLLPHQSRDHMRNAIRELSYAFAQLPRDFATIAERPIEEWIVGIDQPQSAQKPAAPPPPTQHHATPTAATAEHVADPPAPAAADSTPPAPAADSTPPAPAAADSTPPAPAADSTPPAPAADSTPAEPASPPAAEKQPQESNRGPEARIDKSATGNVEIAFIEYNPIGSDLQGEYVVLRNSGTEAITMKGWRLMDEADNTFVFPNFTLAPAGEVRIWTKKGRNTRSDLHWGRATAAWNNTGDTARLVDTEGNEVARYKYEVPKNMRRR